MTEEDPKPLSPCKACGACYYGCPKSWFFSAKALGASLISDKRDDVLGDYKLILHHSKCRGLKVEKVSRCKKRVLRFIDLSDPKHGL
jgi:ferredoxin